MLADDRNFAQLNAWPYRAMHFKKWLPANIRHQATKASFKTHLKTFLFSEFLARF